MPDSYSQLDEPFPLSQGVSTFNEAQEDSINKMWSVYMKESEEYDKHVTDVWRKDTSDILIFAVVFSATVATVLVESYKKLLPDSGDQSPQSPTTSIVCVNTLWALSLVLSLTSALLAILIQRWVRRYTELPLLPRLPNERARVRSYLFLGTLNFGMHHAVEAAPMLLHLSVLLFLIGLVVFFNIVHKAVAIVLSIFVGISGLAYFTLSVLPCLYRYCPYGTPVSSILWCLWHASAFSAAFCLRWILRRFHALLIPYNPGDVESGKQGKLTQWLNSIENSLDKHRKDLKDGFRFGIVQGALEAPVVVDVNALSWLLKLPAMAEKGKIQDFVVNTPGDMLAQLMNVTIEPGKIVFRDQLLALLRSCAPHTIELDEYARRRRLLVCLDAILRIVKVSSDPHGASPSESVLNDIRTNFANIRLMRPLWADADPHIRIISRSICALLARHLVRKQSLDESELAWLQEVMGKSSNAIFNSLDDVSKADSMNFDSYIYGVLANQTADPPAKAATFFMEMVSILASSESQAAFRRSVLERRISESSLVRRAEEQEAGSPNEVIGRLHRVLETVFPSVEQEPRIPNNRPNRRRADGRGLVQIKFPLLSTP